MNGWTPIWKTCGKTIVRKTVPQEFVFRLKTAQSADIRRFILFVFHTPPAPLVGFETEECMSILLESRALFLSWSGGEPLVVHSARVPGAAILRKIRTFDRFMCPNTREGLKKAEKSEKK